MNAVLEEQPAVLEAAGEDDARVALADYASLDAAYERCLVILAMGGACWVEESRRSDGGVRYRIDCEPPQEQDARAELQAYEQERDFETRQRAELAAARAEGVAHHPAGYGMYLLWALALLAVFRWQQLDPALSDRGASSSLGLLRGGEWWRPFTALFLHADAAHLAGNLATGFLFGTWTSRSLGPMLAWFLILLCGSLGNILTSLAVYPEPFLSIGASTAVFASLGLLCGLGLEDARRRGDRRAWWKSLAPLWAGLVLLGLLGGGEAGSRTDVLGHVFGFAAGLPAGWLAGHMRRRAPGQVVA